MEHTQEEISQQQKGEKKIILAITLATILAIINSSTVNIALPTLITYFQTDINVVQWVVVGYMLATGLVTPLVGFWGDQYSYKRMMIVGLILVGVGACACALARNIETLIIFRVIQGVAGGLIMPASTTIIYQFIHGQRQIMAMATVSMALSAGIAIGPSVAGILLNYFGWQAIFLVNIPFVLWAIFLVKKYIPVKVISTGQKIDMVGLVVVTLGTLGILMGFNKGQAWGWMSIKTLTFIVGGLLAIGYFVYHELKISQPMLNFHVFRYNKFTCSLVLNASMAIATCLSPYFMPIFLQNVLRMNAMEAGLALLLPSLVMALASPIAGKLAQRFPIRPIIFVAMLILLGSTFELSRFTLASTVVAVTVWLSLRYLGIGLMMPLVNDFAMASVPEKLLGHASSMMGWVRQLTCTLSTSIFTFIYSARMLAHTKSGLSDGLGAVDQMRYIYCNAINDVTFYSLLILIACVPIIYFFKGERG